LTRRSIYAVHSSSIPIVTHAHQDIFTVHGEAARFVAQEYFRTLAAVVSIGTLISLL